MRGGEGGQGGGGQPGRSVEAGAGRTHGLGRRLGLWVCTEHGDDKGRSAAASAKSLANGRSSAYGSWVREKFVRGREGSVEGLDSSWPERRPRLTSLCDREGRDVSRERRRETRARRTHQAEGRSSAEGVPAGLRGHEVSPPVAVRPWRRESSQYYSRERGGEESAGEIKQGAGREEEGGLRTWRGGGRGRSVWLGGRGLGLNGG